MKRFLDYEMPVFIFLVTLLLFPVLISKYFVTLDGPCHLYNAYMLKNWINHEHIDFYSKFYSINHNPDPNWFSHIVLAGFMMILPALWAEKLLLVLYIVLFAFSFRKIITFFTPGNKWLSLIILPFIYHRTFQMGFYNYCFSLVFMLCTVAVFIYLLKQQKPVILAITCLCMFFITYMAHPIGYLVAIVICGGIWIFNYATCVLAGKSARQILYSGVALALSIAPSMVMLLIFLKRRSVHETVPGTETFSALIAHLFNMELITTISTDEVFWGKLTFMVCVVLVVAGIITKVRRGKIEAYDVFGLGAIGFFAFYFLSPSGIGGAGVLSVRIVAMPFILLMLWFGCIEWNKYVKWGVTFFFGLVTVILIVVRLPIHIASSQLVDEYTTAGKKVKPLSIVLPLNYSYTGIDKNGLPLNKRTWIFTHALNYIAIDKPLIMLDNYEANTGYFPFIWHPEKNPFSYICKQGSIEVIPPQPDIEPYEKQVGDTVNYVLISCLTREYAHHPYTIDVFNQLNKNYNKIYTSPTGRIMLYRHK